jgi:hypothetical protein
MMNGERPGDLANPGRSLAARVRNVRRAAAYGGGSCFRKPGAEHGPGTSGGVWTLPLGVTTVVCPTFGGGPGGKLPNEVQSWVTWPGIAEAGGTNANAAVSAAMTTTRRRFIEALLSRCGISPDE